MHYEEPVSTSEELLRLTLPMIARYQLGANPVNYALMYEYVSGVNPALKAAIDSQLTETGTLDERRARELFRAHVLPDAQQLAELHAEIIELVRSLQASLSDAGEEAGRFEGSLADCNRKLLQSGESNIAGVLHGLIKHTEQMRSSNVKLQAALEHHAREAETLRRELQVARQEATTDPLTGLPNRTGFDAAAARVFAEMDDYEHPVCLLLVDIDNFKLINDQYGHLFGDKVIKIVADILRKCIKGKDTAARFGGEEFMVLLPDTPLVGARALAESVRSAIERARIRRTANGETIGNITLSAGIASLHDGETLISLIERADRAMYRAKQQGRNRVASAEECG